MTKVAAPGHWYPFTASYTGAELLEQHTPADLQRSGDDSCGEMTSFNSLSGPPGAQWSSVLTVAFTNVSWTQ